MLSTLPHSPAFADSLNATHILRVANGSSKLTDKIGDLSDSDFDHSPPKVTAAQPLGDLEGRVQILRGPREFA